MSRYSYEEQETILVFNNSTKDWTVYSCVPKHIRKLADLCELQTIEEENGQPIAVKGLLKEKQVSMKNLRVLSDEQKRLAAERLAKSREAKKQSENVLH
ncbi:hypothetical protein JDS99_28485 [Bacillus cereus group sp. N6]|uniref:hypothetical protein n=1 Tax=Bacillus cereus group sp. N6 TaxID=2794583 RepID=UPI0018F2F138|nr:hypothetical protein [Bacillus cereus group sp. N6]MBJ8113491.1 hypothetical protein [Bacillus cereus group sp. N6]